MVAIRDKRLAARRVRRGVAAVLACALLLGTAAAARPMAAQDADSAAYVDPNLTTAVATGRAPAILAWDHASVTRAEVQAYLEEHGVPHHMFSALSMAIGCLRGPSDLRVLAGAPGAISVWGDEQMTPTLNRSARTAFNGDPEFVWSSLGYTGKGVGIAVLDTGIDATHPDLEYGRRTVLNARVVLSHLEIFGPGNDSCAPDTYQEDLRDSETVSGHGTHLAGVAAGDGTASGGRLRGMAPDADLIGLSIVEQATPQVDEVYPVSLIRFIAGVNYVLTNALVGGPTVAKVALLGWTSDNLFDPWHPHYLAVRDLYHFGISVVMPTGNEGPHTSRCDARETCHFNGLAVGDYAIAVGATPKQSRSVLENYSSRGDPNLQESRGSLYLYQPTLVAPGSYVVAARRPGLVTYAPPLPTPYPLGGRGVGVNNDLRDPFHQALTGTSVSAAHVAGVIAVMQEAALRANGCFLTPLQVRTILESTATAMGGYARWEVGAGALDATAAVLAASRAPRFGSPDPWNCPPGGAAATGA